MSVVYDFDKGMEIYDSVWTIYENKPVNMVIDSILLTMSKDVANQVSATVTLAELALLKDSNHRGRTIKVQGYEIFNSKEELKESLFGS